MDERNGKKRNLENQGIFSLSQIKNIIELHKIH